MRRIATTAIAVVLLAAVPAGAREAGLWATVNQCDPAGNPGAVGVRVSIPMHGSLKHRQQQFARIRIQYFDGAAWQFIGSTGDSGWRHLGRGRGTVQGGTTFQFDPPAAGARLVLRGVVDVQWRAGRHSRAIRARATLPTESGHANPKNPRLHSSQATCQISR
jgi:hypothetical protein